MSVSRPPGSAPGHDLARCPRPNANSLGRSLRSTPMLHLPDGNPDHQAQRSGEHTDDLSTRFHTQSGLALAWRVIRDGESCASRVSEPWPPESRHSKSPAFLSKSSPIIATSFIKWLFGIGFSKISAAHFLRTFSRMNWRGCVSMGVVE